MIFTVAEYIKWRKEKEQEENEACVYDEDKNLIYESIHEEVGDKN